MTSARPRILPEVGIALALALGALLLLASLARASEDCDVSTGRRETVSCCLGRNEKGLCVRFGEQTCTYDVVCCERPGHPEVCVVRNRKCGVCNAI